jgi:hypothetical protein
MLVDNKQNTNVTRLTQWVPLVPKEENRQHNDQKRRTDNTMIKRKKTKGQTTIYKTLHRKLKIE